MTLAIARKGTRREKLTAQGYTARMSMGETTMQNKSPATLQLTLTGRESVGRIVVPLEGFLGYDLSITQSLEALVDRWSDMAAPRATRVVNHSPEPR